MKLAILSGVLAFIIMLIAGCGGGGDDEESDPEPPSVTDPITHGKDPGPPSLTKRCASANPPPAEVCFELIR